ncbi:MAG: NosD domain-containing protein [Bellilinea sp.]
MVAKFLHLILIPMIILGQLLSPPLSLPTKNQLTGWGAIGQAGGPTQGIAVQGEYAYIGVGPRLVVVDISDPANPRPVGASAPFDYFVQGITISGTHAYVATGTAGLYIVEIAEPSNPHTVGSWNSPGFAENVDVTGTTAFLADGSDGLRLVDVTNPATPLEIAHAFDMNYAYDVVVSGRYAYVAAGGAGLLVVEISNPVYPVEAGTYDTPGNARGVATSGGLVWVADERSGLQILNASDPLHPALLGSLQTEGWAFDVTVAGNLAYIASAFGGLRVVNISNPAYPVELGGMSWAQSNATGLVLAGSHVYLTDRKNGLRVINSSDPASPVQIDYWNGFSFAHSVEVAGNYAYVAAGFNGVRVYSLTNPTHPVEVGSFLADGLFYCLKISGDRLYAGTMIESPAKGIYAFDISDPANPQQIGYYGDIAECWGIDIDGNTVYVADAGDLKVFDFSDPPNLDLVGSYPLTPRGLTVRDGLAYVSQEFDGVKIYNVSNPASISLVGSFTSSTSFTHGPVSLAENYAYVSDNWGLRILDVTDPANPTEVSYTPTHDETNWLALSGSRVYVSEGSYGFSLYDVSNPAAPQLLNQTSVLGAVQVLAVNSGKLFTASGEGGLQIFSETAASAQNQPVHQFQAVREAQTIPITAHDHRTQTANLVPDISNIPPAPNRSATTCTVTSAANSGSGTLRACLENQVSGDVITFSAAAFPSSAPVTIPVGPTRLPWLTQGSVTIDASNAGVILDGSLVLGAWDPGIGIITDNNTVRGLQIVNFPMGIDLIGSNNHIGGNRLVGSGPTGQGNVISGNRQDGLAISGHGNIVLGNLIGLDATGTHSLPNHAGGIRIVQSPDNTIGSLNPGEDNIISANGDAGIMLYGYTTSGNKVIGNKVGTDITGNLNFGNQHVGVYVESGSANTLVYGNLISGNGVAEVYVWDFGTDFNVLTGNNIGTNLAGTAPLPNLTRTGIATGSAAYTRIGGTAPGERNIVANPNGVSVWAPFGANTLVLGNYIGLNAVGSAVFTGTGGLFLGGASRSIVGGVTPAEANYITADGNFSLELRSPNNVIAGNFFGLADDGETPLATAGFQVWSLRDGNMIQGNQIANSTSAGIWLYGAQSNTIRRSSIWANPFKGVYLDNANNNLPAPAFSLSTTGGSGSTCSGCTVELFLDAANQGRYFLASVTADGVGSFTFPAFCPLPYTHLTATATDVQGNTSEFSDFQVVPWDCSATRPVPTLGSLDPTNQPVFSPTFLLALTGTGFYPDSVVRWDGIALPTMILSSTLAQAAIPSYLFWAGGDFPVTIFTPAPGGGESSTLIFNVAPPTMIYLPMVRR